MNQLIAIALGGACGSVLRFLVSTGIYQWLGRGFPYGTLTVNVIGSFLIGMLAEALILQRIIFTMEYRAAILVGVLGGFTTFSSFSLETLYLIEQGNLNKALLNILVSVVGCLLAVWIGLLSARVLFIYSNGAVPWLGGTLPYALIVVNAVGAFLIGIVATLLLHKVAISLEYRAALVVVLVGVYLTLSGLYLILYLLEHGHTFDQHLNLMLAVFVINSLSCMATLWLGLLIAKQV